jgi:hypothetical protein
MNSNNERNCSRTTKKEMPQVTAGKHSQVKKIKKAEK